MQTAIDRLRAFISIHSPHARGDSYEIEWRLWREISIHSPHARGDQAGQLVDQFIRYFNPLPSCEGRRVYRDIAMEGVGFQSTPLMRGETNPRIHMIHFVKFQSTPLMRGETAAGRDDQRAG